MKTLITILFLSLLSSPSWSEDMLGLHYRDGLYYEPFSDVPFTGDIASDGWSKGTINNGKKHGTWISYWENGQPHHKENYINGNKEGEWISYWENGQLNQKGNYKNGKREGAWSSYTDDGQVFRKGNYKNGKREGAWIEYYSGGGLYQKGTYKNGREEGMWIKYETHGGYMKNLSGIYKDGKKISDLPKTEND